MLKQTGFVLTTAGKINNNKYDEKQLSFGQPKKSMNNNKSSSSKYQQKQNNNFDSINMINDEE